jgi:hypothetical protein
MSSRGDRFKCILDPCGLWLIWDGLREAPAELGEVLFCGLSEMEARRNCRRLNIALAEVLDPDGMIPRNSLKLP